jgi:hypothetical protein
LYVFHPKYTVANDAIAPVIDPTIDPTRDSVLRVLLPPLDDDADELEAGEGEVCVAESWAALLVCVAEFRTAGVVLTPAAPAGEFVASMGTEYVAVAVAAAAVRELSIEE